MQLRVRRKTLNGKSCPSFLPIELIGRQWINSLLDQSIRVTQECEVHNGSGKRMAAWENLCVLRMRTDNNIIATISPSSISSLLWLSIGTSAFLTNFLLARSGSVARRGGDDVHGVQQTGCGKNITHEEQFKLLTAYSGALGKKVNTLKFCNSESTRTRWFRGGRSNLPQIQSDTNLFRNGM